jgi:hypothetical protein
VPELKAITMNTISGASKRRKSGCAPEEHQTRLNSYKVIA